MRTKYTSFEAKVITQAVADFLRAQGVTEIDSKQLERFQDALSHNNWSATLNLPSNAADINTVSLIQLDLGRELYINLAPIQDDRNIALRKVVADALEREVMSFLHAACEAWFWIDGYLRLTTLTLMTRSLVLELIDEMEKRAPSANESIRDAPVHPIPPDCLFTHINNDYWYM